MIRIFGIFFLTAVSAFPGLSLFILPQIDRFDTPWNDDYLNYGLVSTISFAAACDWADGSMLQEIVANNENYFDTTCGDTCKRLYEIFDGMPKVNSLYSPSDHISVVTMAKQTMNCPSISSILDCKVSPSGSVFEEKLTWFLSFRGTYMYDVVNWRRNFMKSMVLVTICAQCAAAQGPYRNFVALRFQIARMILRTSTYVPAHQKEHLGIVGVSMGGQLGQLSAAWLGVERSILSQGVFSLMTHGSPRLANLQLAKEISSAGDIPYVAMVMYRDPIPHHPPMIYGYKSASRKIMWLYVEPWYYAARAQGETVDYDGALRYKEFIGGEADEQLASQLAFYDVSDHLKYSLPLDDSSDLALCGGHADRFYLNTGAVNLYDQN
jgi:hypothetical protein